MNLVVGSVGELLERFAPKQEEFAQGGQAQGGDRISRGAELRRFTQSRLVEISGEGGGAVLTLAFSLLRDAQERGESVLWLSSPLKPFYPEDAWNSGVDLDRLPILFLTKPEQAFSASSKLLASGGFGLLVWDLASWKRPDQKLPLAFLGRLHAMARHHRASVLILTDKAKEEPSLGCLVSLRLQVEAQEHHPELLEVEVVRDKRGAVGRARRWDWRCGLPDGLPSATSVSPTVITPAATRLAV